MNFKEWIKNKYELAKEIVIRKSKEIWVIIKRDVSAMWDLLKPKIKALFNKIVTKLKELGNELYNKLLKAEVKMLEKFADSLWAKAESILGKLMERLGIDPEVEENDASNIDDIVDVVDG